MSSLPHPRARKPPSPNCRCYLNAKLRLLQRVLWILTSEVIFVLYLLATSKFDIELSEANLLRPPVSYEVCTTLLEEQEIK